jgi:hypothetical protein
VHADKPEDIFLGEVWSGGKMGVKKRRMDVHLDQFLSGRLGPLANKKKILDFIKNIFELAI